jgi:cell wall-associated NlpC family hydrolase
MYYRRYRRRTTTGERVAIAAIAVVVLSGAHAVATGPAKKSTPVPVAAASGRAAEAIAYATAQLRCPYTWAGTGPCSAGFDCSGLTQGSWAAAGISIPRTSEGQYAGLPAVSAADLKPGDLVFSEWSGVDNQPSPNHVQLYVGSGYVIGADSTNVERVPLSTDAGHIVGYARPGGA